MQEPMRSGRNGTGKSPNSSDEVSTRDIRIRHGRPANLSERNICIPVEYGEFGDNKFVTADTNIEPSLSSRTERNIPIIKTESNHQNNIIENSGNVGQKKSYTFDAGTQTGPAQSIRFYDREESMQTIDRFNLTTVSESGVVYLNSNEICDVVSSKPKQRVARKRITIMPSVKIEYFEDISVKDFTGTIDLTLDEK